VNPTQPHILLITTDQQRHDTIGPRKPPYMRTPHLDRLCDQGVRFSSAYSECPLCVPARRTIMTGRSIFAMAGDGFTSYPPIADASQTLPACLGRAGYQTILVGKMHVGEPRVRYGFDQLYLNDAYYRQMQRSGNPLQPMLHGMNQNEHTPAMSTVPEAMTLTSWITERCVDIIQHERDPSAPLFLWASYGKPHPPLDPPEPYYSMYRNCNIEPPVRGDWSDDERMPEAMRRVRDVFWGDRYTPEILREIRAAYYGLITQIDYNIGRIIAALRDQCLWDDTLVIFTSDHGEFLGDHNMFGKCFWHEASAHVPFVMKLPESWRGTLAGTTCEHPVGLADVMPTLVRAGGGAVPDGCDGMDLLALLRGEIEKPRPYVEGAERQSVQWFKAESPIDYVAITDGNWKYIYYPGGGIEHLFDLKSDPHELCNLAADPAFDNQRRLWRQRLIERHANRTWGLVEQGELVRFEESPIPLAERRLRSWDGAHGEKSSGCVKH
jgi:arylsulfatase